MPGAGRAGWAWPSPDLDVRVSLFHVVSVLRRCLLAQPDPLCLPAQSRTRPEWAEWPLIGASVPAG